MEGEDDRPVTFVDSLGRSCKRCDRWRVHLGRIPLLALDLLLYLELYNKYLTNSSPLLPHPLSHSLYTFTITLLHFIIFLI